jgi:hypothetical protein
MWMRMLRSSLVLIVAVAFTGGVARGIGFVMSQTKEELKLKYDVAVQDHGTGRVTVVLTLADEGRLAPLDEVQLVIPGRQTEKDGSHWMDLVVSIDMRKAADGTRVGRVHLLKEWAERAEIQLNTHAMDGKVDVTTRLHHVIPVAKYMKTAPAPATKPVVSPAADAPPAAPPATERK